MKDRFAEEVFRLQNIPVCGKHFRPEDFTTVSKETPLVFQKPRLKRQAILSVLSCGETADGKNLKQLTPLEEPLSLCH